MNDTNDFELIPIIRGTECLDEDLRRNLTNILRFYKEKDPIVYDRVTMTVSNILKDIESAKVSARLQGLRRYINRDGIWSLDERKENDDE